MIERKEIANCQRKVALRLDYSTRAVTNRLSASMVKMNCPIISAHVNLAANDFLAGYPLAIYCMNKDCQFFTHPNVVKSEDSTSAS